MHTLSPDNPLPAAFLDLEAIVEGVARGAYTSVAASGAPGIGKTYVVQRKLRAMTYRRCELYRHATLPGLIRKLWDYRDGGILLLDDADGLFMTSSAVQLNLLKAVFENKAARTITYDTVKARQRVDDADPPPAFETRARVIWTTNIDIADPSNFPRQTRDHIAAISSRLSCSIGFSHDATHILDYVLHLATHGNMLRAYPLAVQNDAIRYFVEHARCFKEISARALINIADLRRQNPERFLSLAGRHLMAEPRTGLIVPPIPVLFPLWQRSHGAPLVADAAIAPASEPSTTVAAIRGSEPRAEPVVADTSGPSTRGGVLSEVASMLIGGDFREAKITASASNVLVEACDRAVIKFAVASLPPVPGFIGVVGIGGFNKVDGAIVYCDIRPEQIERQATIKAAIPWNVTLDGAGYRKVVLRALACHRQLATPYEALITLRIAGDALVGVGPITLDKPVNCHRHEDARATELRLDAKGLAWLMRKNVDQIQITRVGIVCVTVGRYRFFLRQK